MAKKREASKHSRAARRATSPGIDLDKSLKDIKPPSRSASRPSVLAVQTAGIHKKSKRGRKSQMSAKARRRHEKGIEMAEAVVERTGKKVERSLGRERTGKERRKAWDAVNKAAEAEEAAADDAGSGEEIDDGEKGWVTDEDMDAAPVVAGDLPAADAPSKSTQDAIPAADADGDEIL
ncbi:hypothetical protein S40285_06749 [Stachybotrys chlorohalonatus IBT 40285]|uniref:Ribosome biogenesis protein Alb1 n=1 Tax=Stachybotrys chlorohalonatus (strain IBT 40285) TaxID=1283841 RepID=A0A084QJW7_STAC4|nr:hypothetical protein S40285_06749 [Stachybotrys chlorohalonata IBT 40285]